MQKNINTTYGIGGFDESKPNNNIIEIIETYDVVLPMISVDKVKLFLELSERELYETLENNLNSLSEKEKIIFNYVEKIKIDDNISLKIKSILKLTDVIWEEIFIGAEKQII